MITSNTRSYYNITGNPNFNLTVEFQSRFQENTTVTWYRDDNVLPEERIQTTYTNEMYGITVLNFMPISRSDTGIYQVTVRNTVEVIPTGLMTSMAVFQLQICGESKFPGLLLLLSVYKAMTAFYISLVSFLVASKPIVYQPMIDTVYS